jgi:hypothetical protein
MSHIIVTVYRPLLFPAHTFQVHETKTLFDSNRSEIAVDIDIPLLHINSVLSVSSDLYTMRFH